MYLIDTDILIWVLRGSKTYEEFLQELKVKDVLSLSTISIAEIYKNIYPSELIKSDNLINEFQVFDVTSSIAKQAGLYWQEHVKRLKNLSLSDCLIAATANVHNLTLVSLSTKHFPMKDIQVMKP